MDSNDEFDKLIAIAATKTDIPTKFLMDYIEQTTEEMNSYVLAAKSVNADWKHLEKELPDEGEGLGERVIILGHLLRAVTAAKDSWLKLFNRFIMMVKWLNSRGLQGLYEKEADWYDEESLEEFKEAKWMFDKYISRIQKATDIAESHYRNKIGVNQKADINVRNLRRLQDRLQEAEEELFELKLKRARRDESMDTTIPGTQGTNPKPMEENIPRLVDEGEEDELWEGEEELMVLDETGDDEHQEEPEQLVNMNDQPQEKPEQAARLDDEPQVVQEQEEQLDDDDRYLAHMIEEADRPIPQANEPLGRQENQQVEQVVQELQNKREELRQLREDFERWERTIRILPRRILQDLEQAPHVRVECVFCNQVNRHFSDSCPIVTDGEERFRITRRAGLCHKCLMHCPIGRCRFPTRRCFYCDWVRGTRAEEFRPNDRGHHKALCTVPNAEGILRLRVWEARERYHILEQEILQLQTRQADVEQALPPARRQEQH